MLVPAMQSTGTRSSSSTFSTPTCAPPLAPPPARTRTDAGPAGRLGRGWPAHGWLRDGRRILRGWRWRGSAGGHERGRRNPVRRMPESNREHRGHLGAGAVGRHRVHDNPPGGGCHRWRSGRGWASRIPVPSRIGVGCAILNGRQPFTPIPEILPCAIIASSTSTARGSSRPSRRRSSRSIRRPRRSVGRIMSSAAPPTSTGRSRPPSAAFETSSRTSREERDRPARAHHRGLQAPPRRDGRRPSARRWARRCGSPRPRRRRPASATSCRRSAC